MNFRIHTAEIHNDEETESILRFKPDRIGHGTFIPPQRCNNPKLLQLLMETKIPLGNILHFFQYLVYICLKWFVLVELCLTSNVMSKTVSSYESHHLLSIMECNLPFTISVTKI